jgi:hypothetical protein
MATERDCPHDSNSYNSNDLSVVCRHSRLMYAIASTTLPLHIERLFGASTLPPVYSENQRGPVVILAVAAVVALRQ